MKPKREKEKWVDHDPFELCIYREMISKGQSKKGFWHCKHPKHLMNMHKSDCRKCKDYEKKRYDIPFISMIPKK